MNFEANLEYAFIFSHVIFNKKFHAIFQKHEKDKLRFTRFEYAKLAQFCSRKMYF